MCRGICSLHRLPCFLTPISNSKATAWASGATVGALWKINERHSLGAVYRKPILDQLPGQRIIEELHPGSRGAECRGGANPVPQSVAFGYAFRPTPKLKLEVDADWTDWDMLNNVRLHWGKGPLNGYVIPFNWMDSWFYEFGTSMNSTNAGRYALVTFSHRTLFRRIHFHHRSLIRIVTCLALALDITRNGSAWMSCTSTRCWRIGRFGSLPTRLATSTASGQVMATP